MDNREEKLNEVLKKCLSCQKCSLCKTRTKIVFSAGVPNDKLMLIGEAPGYYEDQKGEPFVGKAGQLLDKILECVGFSRKTNIYICNTIKCRPPENRNPLPEEKAACREYLDKQLEVLKQVSYNVSGPVILNYVNWILQSCVQKNINKVYFLARDGYILQKFAQKICEEKKLNIQCKYLYCSRYSLRLATYNLIKDEKYNLIFNKSHLITLNSILKKINVSESKIKLIAHQINFPNVNKVLTKAEFENALSESLKSDKVSFIEVKIDRFENVLPMVPAGGALYNMILD